LILFHKIFCGQNLVYRIIPATAMAIYSESQYLQDAYPRVFF
jgi:hypothetical protein